MMIIGKNYGRIHASLPSHTFAEPLDHIEARTMALPPVVVDSTAMWTASSCMQQQRRQGRKSFEFSSRSVGFCPVYWLIEGMFQSIYLKALIYNNSKHKSLR